jgi:hypothetical protein
MPVTLTAVQNSVDQKDLGVATSSSQFFRSMGSAFGVAIFGAIMNARLRHYFPKFVHAPASYHLHATSIAYSPAKVAALPTAIRLGVIDAFAHSLHVVFLFAAPLALLALPFALLIKELPLRARAYIGSTGAMEAPEMMDEDGLDAEDAHAGEAARMVSTTSAPGASDGS